MKRLCSKTTTKVNDELEKWFPTQDVMDVLGLVHPQYWLKCSSERPFYSYGHFERLLLLTQKT